MLDPAPLGRRALSAGSIPRTPEAVGGTNRYACHSDEDDILVATQGPTGPDAPPGINLVTMVKSAGTLQPCHPATGTVTPGPPQTRH